jgi:hypothetical protein
MAARMSRSKLFAFLASAIVFACERDPASNVKIVARPATQAGSALDTAKPFVTPPFRSDLCNVQAEQPKGSSSFVFNGPCDFHQIGYVKCRAAIDDFYTMVVRQGPAGATVSVYVNIEAYHGPGKYSGGQMFLTVQDGFAYYHWSNDSVRTIVGPGLRYVEVPKTRLEAEPPNTGTEIVSGKFWCDPHPAFDTAKIVR